MAIDTSITLTYTVKQTDAGTTNIVFRATGYQVSSAVFAIEVLPRSADFAAPNYRFSHVCSPAELSEFPEGDPGDGCYFRTDTVEFMFDTQDMVDHVVANMYADISKLVRELLNIEQSGGMSVTMTFDGTNTGPLDPVPEPSVHYIYGLPVDPELSATSENAVENRVITQALDGKQPLITNESKVPYNLIDGAPSVNNGALTLKIDGETAAVFHANDAGDVELDIRTGQVDVERAERAAAQAGRSATLSESYAVGATGTREGEDVDNSMYYARQAASNAQTSADYTATTRNLRNQTQALYDSVLAVISTQYVGYAFNYGLTVDGTVLSLVWTDPADTDVVKWRRTRLVMKTGGFPEDEDDGTVLVDNYVHNQYQSVPFQWDAGTTSDYYFALFTESTGGIWNTGPSAPRFATDVQTWATLGLMSRAGTILQYPGLGIGGVIDMPASEYWPSARLQLMHTDYTGSYQHVSDFMVDNTREHNSIWMPQYLCCLEGSQNAAMMPFDPSESAYGPNWDETFMSGREYDTLNDSTLTYTKLIAGTDYQVGDSCADWVAEHGTDLYVKNGSSRTNGCNIYKESWLRQMLNMDAGQTFVKQNPFDAAPGTTYPGFYGTLVPGLKSIVQRVRVFVARNTLAVATWGAGGGFDLLEDILWLPSQKEIFNVNTGGYAEGQQFAYFRDITVEASARIRRDPGGTARNTWMRSPNVSYGYNVYIVSTSGAPQNNTANSSYALSPVLCI